VPFAPTVTVTGAFDMNPNQPWLERSQLVEFDVKFSWITGRHAFRFGGMGLHQSQRLQTQFQTSGVFTFDGTFTGNAVADYLLGRPVAFRQGSTLDNLERSNTYAAFIQDDIKVGRRVTLNLGLRYDLFQPWEEDGGKAATLIPGQQSQRFPNAPPGLVYPDDPGVPDGLVATDKNNVAPRAGFAWDVRGDGRTAVRGAYGIFYTPQGSITIANQNEAPPFVQIVAFAPPNLRNPYEGRTSPFPYAAAASGDALFAFPTQIFSTDPAFRTGYVHQFNINVQQQFGPDVIVQVGYFGSQGRQLSYSREINAAVYGPGATAANAQQRRPYFPEFFAGISQAFSDGSSEYNALQVSATKKYSRGYTLQLAYTLSKSMDDRSAGSTDAGTVQNPNDPFDGEWGLSDFDQRHILRINGVWDLPRLENHGWLRHVLGSWRLAGIVSKVSGQPFTVISGRDRALVGPSRGLGAQRPDLVGDPELDVNRPRPELIQQYFNTAAFALPEIGQFGNAGRNRLVGPGSFVTDASISKRFEPWSGMSRRGFEVRIEVFNLFNFVNLRNPVANMSSPAFGQIQAAGDARVFQLGFRFDF
jgi:TonB dependent receptor